MVELIGCDLAAVLWRLYIIQLLITFLVTPCYLIQKCLLLDVQSFLLLKQVLDVSIALICVCDFSDALLDLEIVILDSVWIKRWLLWEARQDTFRPNFVNDRLQSI